MSSSATPLPEIASKSINWSIALSVLLILAGFFALLVPFISGIGITVFIGWAMVISGIFHFVFAFKSHTTGSVLWEILLGALYVFSGFYLISHPLSGLLSLTLLLIVYLVFEGIIELVHAFQIRPRAGSGWLIFDGIITLILALMIWRSWPASTVWAIGTLVGISMIFSGFSRLMLSLAAKRALA
jgi:uncharacterized membrane protein HdeD (DUF308 family)